MSECLPSWSVVFFFSRLTAFAWRRELALPRFCRYDFLSCEEVHFFYRLHHGR